MRGRLEREGYLSLDRLPYSHFLSLFFRVISKEKKAAWDSSGFSEKRFWERLWLPGKQESVKHKKGHCAGVENKNMNKKRDKDILWDLKTAAATLCNSYYFLYVIRTYGQPEAVIPHTSDQEQRSPTDTSLAWWFHRFVFSQFLSQHQTFEFV